MSVGVGLELFSTVDYSATIPLGPATGRLQSHAFLRASSWYVARCLTLLYFSAKYSIKLYARPGDCVVLRLPLKVCD